MAKKKKRVVKKFSFQTIILVLFFCFTALLYLHNLTRDVYSGDIGDLVTAAYVGGVAHPPGYPLLTSVGFLLTHLPLPLPPVSKVGLISVFASLLGLFFFYKLSLKASKNFVIALLSTSVLAFSYLFWFYAEVPEVFALNNFFVIILFYFAIEFHDTKQLKYLYLLAFFAGLSMTNQHQIIAIFPSLAFLIFVNIKKIWQRKRSIPYAIILFILGFLPYLYILIAASHQPPVNWDNAINLENIKHLFLRLDYIDYSQLGKGGLSYSQRLPILQVYATTSLANYSFLIVLITLLGIPLAFVKNKIKTIGYLTGFIISGPIFIYMIATLMRDADSLGVIERLYIESIIVFLLFLPYGLLTLLYILEKIMPRKIYAILGIVILFVVPFMMLRYNFPKTDLSTTQIGNNLGYDILSSLPPNAILFPHSDVGVFNTWYVHYALKYRPDVDVIPFAQPVNNLFRDKIANEFYKKYPNKKATNDEILEKELPELIKKRPVFTTYAFAAIPSSLIAVPNGIIYKIIEKKDIPNEVEYLKLVAKTIQKIHLQTRNNLSLSEQNLVTPTITRFYSTQFINVGSFIDGAYGDPTTAMKYFQSAITIDDENYLAYASLGIADWEITGKCGIAEQNLKKAITYDIYYKPYYLNLHMIYKKCNAPKKSIDALSQKYNSLFLKDIDKESVNSL